MDYYSRIQSSIDFIEQHLHEELKITEIAAKSCFSAFHFQRLFQAISGFSVQEYIRKRRLSEASILLKETDQNILEIAISFQYGSHEAFSRAFENFFGMTPMKFRKSEVELQKLYKINLLDFKNKLEGELMMNKPDIIQLNKILIVGHEYKTNLNNERYFEEIPQFYEDFGRNEYYLKIPNKAAPDMAYGIACNFQDEGDFSFVIGEEVLEFVNDLVDGLTPFEIPEGKYAEFKVNGSVQNTRRYIYGTWLPNSNYERREGPDFEVTDVRNSIFPHDIKMKVFIPVK